MKLTFVIVGTLVEFSMDIEPNSPYTKPTKVYYGCDEYEVKLYSQSDTEMLFHLYLVPNDNDEKLKQMVKELEKLDDELPNGIQYELMQDTGIYNFDFKYAKGGIEHSQLNQGEVILSNKQLDKHQLQQRLNQAIKDENYELCAELRDKINEI